MSPFINEAGGASKTAAISQNAKGNRQSVGRHLYSKRAVALTFSVSRRTVDNWMAQKRIPYIRFSARLIRFNLERVRQALEKYEVKEVGRTR